MKGRGAVADFLTTAGGRARVRAFHHLLGGVHRVRVVFSQSLTAEEADGLLPAFMRVVDAFTLSGQESVGRLPPLQQKIVKCLGQSARTMLVKEIAARLFATPPTVSSQLQVLRALAG